MTPAINCLAVSTTPLTNLSPVSTTPAINLFHRVSVISNVADTGNKFTTGVIDTAEQFLPVTTTPVINLSGVSMTLLNNDRR
jgi:hypothetical protein